MVKHFVDNVDINVRFIMVPRTSASETNLINAPTFFKQRLVTYGPYYIQYIVLLQDTYETQESFRLIKRSKKFEFKVYTQKTYHSYGGNNCFHVGVTQRVIIVNVFNKPSCCRFVGYAYGLGYALPCGCRIIIPPSCLSYRPCGLLRGVAYATSSKK